MTSFENQAIKIMTKYLLTAKFSSPLFCYRNINLTNYLFLSSSAYEEPRTIVVWLT